MQCKNGVGRNVKKGDAMATVILVHGFLSFLFARTFAIILVIASKPTLFINYFKHLSYSVKSITYVNRTDRTSNKIDLQNANNIYGLLTDLEVSLTVLGRRVTTIFPPAGGTNA